MQRIEQLVGQVQALWRYPVKSMGGERVESLFAGPEGIAGDRLLAFESAGAPRGKPLLRGAERAVMLRCRARTLSPGAPGSVGHVEVELPDGRCFPAHDPALPTVLQALASRPDAQGSSFLAEPVMWLRSSERPHTGCRPIALISCQRLQQLSDKAGSPIDANRFRANLLLDLFAPGGSSAEDAFAGHTLQIGEHAVLMVRERTPRCRVITIDPSTGETMPELMELLARRHQGRAGIYAATMVPGWIREGDPILLLNTVS